MRTESALETSVSYGHLTRLIAREDFIEFSSRESYRSYFLYLSSDYSFPSSVYSLPFCASSLSFSSFSTFSASSPFSYFSSTHPTFSHVGTQELI
jgi:hypothetical protein